MITRIISKYRQYILSIYSREVLSNKLITNAGYLWTVNIIGAATGFVFWAIATKLYNSSDVGFASSVISIVQLLTGLSNVGLGIGLVKFLSESDNPPKLLNSIFNFNLISGLFVGIVYLIGVDFWAPSLKIINSRPLLILGFLSYLSLTNIWSILLSAYIGFRQARYAFWQTIWFNLLRLLFVFVMISLGTRGIIASIMLGLFISIIMGVFLYLPRLDLNYSFKFILSVDVLQKIIPFSIGSFIADFIYRTPTLIAPIIALELQGPESSAFVYIALMVSSTIIGPALALSQSSLAEGSFKPTDTREIILSSGLYAFVITLIISIIVYLGGNWILFIFGQSYSTSAANLLRWLAIASPFVALNGIYFSGLRIRNHIRKLMLINGIVGAIALIYPLIFINTQGITSIGIGWCLAQLVVLLFIVDSYFKNRL